MLVQGQHYRTIWQHPEDATCIQIIDQRALPHRFIIEDIRTVEQMAAAIKEMHLRGAGLIGAAAAYGMYLAVVEAVHLSEFEQHINTSAVALLATRPTAVNLAVAVEAQLQVLKTAQNTSEALQLTLSTAHQIADQDAQFCQQIGSNGLAIIEALSHQKNGAVVNILTHCNAGWLAFVDYGSATAPIYAAHAAGINVHVWVDETRPRNQGARLTAWELEQQGVPYTVIADNTGGYLMQQGMVDVLITGTDRTTYTGDVCNKIGTYLKALAAYDNNIPFYVALPSSSFDWKMSDGIREIPIEQRDATEVKYIQGLHQDTLKKVLLTPHEAAAANFGFDVTPARLVTGLITERGVCGADAASIAAMYPDKVLHTTK